MITRIWFGESSLWWLLLPLSLLYGLVSGSIRLAYRLGLKRSWRAPVPILVVGNLTAGGNGKTPVVIWLVEQLSRRNIRVGVVSRGYGGKAAQYPLLLNAMISTAEAGDEPVLIYQRTGAPVAVSPNRADAVRALLAERSVQLIVTDDGLQHYALARDKEIVVIDGIRRFGNGWWLPAGPMRERAARLRSVDAVIVNGGHPKTGEIPMRLTPGQAINLWTGERRDIAQLPSLVAMAGIGHPARFFETLEQHGARIEKRVSLIDHQVLSYEKIAASLATEEQTLIMTEKDAVKCRSFAKNNWWYLPVNAELIGEQPEQLLNDLIALVHSDECNSDSEKETHFFRQLSLTRARFLRFVDQSLLKTRRYARQPNHP